jgi:uncharacterized protein YnzC (UPF0291/DUF896 family)
MQFKHILPISKLSMVVLSILCATNLLAQNIKEDGMEFPVPADNANQLFYLQRNENINTLVYELNEKNGTLNTETPIHTFWILYAKKSQRQELTEMEKKFAYGIKIISSEKEQIKFSLVSCPKISLQLMKARDKEYHVYVTPDKQQMVLRRIYIKIKKGGFKLEPNVEYIELKGTDVLSGKEIVERIKP